MRCGRTHRAGGRTHTRAQRQGGARRRCMGAALTVQRAAGSSNVTSGVQQAASTPPPRYILATIFSCWAAREHDTAHVLPPRKRRFSATLKAHAAPPLRCYRLVHHLCASSPAPTAAARRPAGARGRALQARGGGRARGARGDPPQMLLDAGVAAAGSDTGGGALVSAPRRMLPHARRARRVSRSLQQVGRGGRAVRARGRAGGRAHTHMHTWRPRARRACRRPHRDSAPWSLVSQYSSTPAGPPRRPPSLHTEPDLQERVAACLLHATAACAGSCAQRAQHRYRTAHRIRTLPYLVP